MPVIVEQVEASKQSVKGRQTLNNKDKITLNCPPKILQAFQNLLKDSPVLGTSFVNPYTHETEWFPSQTQDLNPRHLQILARNEESNVTGVINSSLYNGLLTQDEIARLRCLVKGMTVTGVVNIYAYGGYGTVNVPLEAAQRTLIVDQSGLQWQADFRNTGGMFFYPDNPDDNRLPTNYHVWQQDMYELMLGQKRSATSSENHLRVIWKKVPGVIDLDQVQNAIAQEFLQAFDSAISQGDRELTQDQHLNFKFLKAGMGCFADGIVRPNSPQSDALGYARLKGIKQALRYLINTPEGRYLGKMKRLELPFSHQPGASEILQNIEQLTTQLGLAWGGTPNEDALMPRAGFINATTNCADPHAMIGNEGGHQSVDASISTNAAVLNLNMGFNTNPFLSFRSKWVPLEIKAELSTPTQKFSSKHNKRFFALSMLLTVITGVIGVLVFGPIGLILAGIVAVGLGGLAWRQGRLNKRDNDASSIQTVSERPSSIAVVLPSSHPRVVQHSEAVKLLSKDISKKPRL